MMPISWVISLKNTYITSYEAPNNLFSIHSINHEPTLYTVHLRHTNHT
jgi:hypothetical protein